MDMWAPFTLGALRLLKHGRMVLQYLGSPHSPLHPRMGVGASCALARPRPLWYGHVYLLSMGAINVGPPSTFEASRHLRHSVVPSSAFRQPVPPLHALAAFLCFETAQTPVTHVCPPAWHCEHWDGAPHRRGCLPLFARSEAASA